MDIQTLFYIDGRSGGIPSSMFVPDNFCHPLTEHIMPPAPCRTPADATKLDGFCYLARVAFRRVGWCAESQKLVFVRRW